MALRRFFERIDNILCAERNFLNFYFEFYLIFS